MHNYLPLILMLVMDISWIGFINNKRYQQMVFKVQKSKLSLNLIGAFIAYFFMAIGYVFIVLPNAINDKNKNIIWKALKHGALFGLIVYAVFNGTNLAIFKEYDVLTAFMDTAWGTFLYFTITLFGLWLYNRKKN